MKILHKRSESEEGSRLVQLMGGDLLKGTSMKYGKGAFKTNRV